MSDAYQCDRCGDFGNRSGYQTRYGIYTGTSGFKSQYDFIVTAELCKECKSELDELVTEYMDNE